MNNKHLPRLFAQALNENRLNSSTSSYTRRHNEPLDVAGISSWHSKHRGGVRYGHVLFDYRPSRAQISFISCRNRSYGFYAHDRRRADADLGRRGDLVQLIAGRVKQERTALVLCRIALNADSVRRCLCSLVKTY